MDHWERHVALSSVFVKNSEWLYESRKDIRAEKFRKAEILNMLGELVICPEYNNRRILAMKLYKFLVNCHLKEASDAISLRCPRRHQS